MGIISITRRSSAALLAVHCITIVGCTDVPTEATGGSISGAAQHSVVPPGGFTTMDDRFRALATTIPGFGGLYRDKAGVVHVKLVDPSKRDVAAPIVLAFIRDLGMILGGQAAELSFESAQYDFVQLTDHYRRLRASLPRTGVTQTDIDDRSNHIVIGVRDASTIPTLTATVNSLGIPDGMVVVKVISPTVTSVGLRDIVRPVMGGLKITVNTPDQRECTMGFQITLQDALGYFTSSAHFITNSHCFNQTGVPAAKGTGSTYANVGQPDLANPIGFEEYDAPFTAPYYCRPGRSCRYSDATLVALNPGTSSQMGRVARLYPEGDALAPINDLWVTWHLDNGMVGNPATKVGQRTGQTSGTIQNVCVDVVEYYVVNNEYVDSGVDILCQDQADYYQQSGDSGSPVFTAIFNGEAHPLGLHWGTGGFGQYGDIRAGDLSTYSTIASVRYDVARGYSMQEWCESLPSQQQPGCPPYPGR